MPVKARRKSKRPTYRRRKKSNFDLQKWLLNLVIFCLAIVVVGFIFSMGKRFSNPREKITLSQTNTLPAEQQPFKEIVVEVLNGCGTPGVAQKFTNYLRQNGFDVIYTGNADRQDYASTILIGRTPGNKIAAVNAVMLLEADRLFTKVDSTVQADLTLVIGKDYAKLPVYRRILEIGEKY